MQKLKCQRWGGEGKITENLGISEEWTHFFHSLVAGTWRPGKFSPAWWKMSCRKRNSLFHSCLAGGPPSVHFFPGRERKSQNRASQLCYQQPYWEAMVSFGLVFKWVITISPRRGRGKSYIAVTTSQRGPKGLESYQSRNPQRAWSGNFWGLSFVWQIGLYNALTAQQDSAW